MASAYPQRLSSKDPRNWTFDDIYTAQGDLRTANGNLANAINRAENVRQDPGATIQEIQAAIDKINNDIAFHFGSKAQGDEVVERLKGILNSDARTPHPLFTDPGTERAFTLNEISDYQVAMSDLEQNIIPFARNMQSQAKAKRSELEAKLRRKQTEQNSVTQQKLEQAVEEQSNDTVEATATVGAGSTAADAVNADTDKTTTQNPPVGASTEGEDNTAGQNSNAEPVILRKARENAVIDTALPSPNSSAEDGYTINTENNQASTVNNGVQFQSGFSETITTSENPLLNLAHYTYNIGIYLQSETQYRNMMITKRRSTEGLPKILESGGTGAINGSDAIFPDVHIEDLEIDSLMPNNTGGAHNSVMLRFNILEPMGFSLIPKLKKLCDDNGMSSFAKQHYLLVIKFQGYDEDGKEIVTEDANGRLTKFIPFIFTRINTTVRTGAVQYRCEAMPPTYNIGISQKRTTIQSQFEVTGRTLNDLFNAAGDISSANYETGLGTVGVIAAMNKQQQDYLDKGLIEVKDEFEVEFLGGIGDSKVLQPTSTSTDKSRTAMDPESTSSYNAVSRQGMDKTKQKFATVAGMPMQQFIQLMVENSEYVLKQQKAYKDPKTKEIVQNADQGKFLQWFNISMETTPIAFDKKRNDYAYHIKYIVSPKKIEDPKSANFQKAPFRGVHKKYAYYFTGENTEVLDYEQEINTQFFTVMNGDVPEPEKESGPDVQDEGSGAPQNKGGQGGLQADGVSGVGEVTNLLYSPIDFAKSEMTIFGDPDFIQQSEIFYSPGNFSPFMPDQSVNMETSEVLYEIFFRTMQDYDDDTGEAILQDPNLKSKVEEEATGTKGLIYRLIKLTTRFSKGVMTQNIEGLLREFSRREEKRIADRQRDAEKMRKVAIADNRTRPPKVDPNQNSYVKTKVINADQEGKDAIAAMENRARRQEARQKRQGIVFPDGGGA